MPKSKCHTIWNSYGETISLVLNLLVHYCIQPKLQTFLDNHVCLIPEVVSLVVNC